MKAQLNFEIDHKAIETTNFVLDFAKRWIEANQPNGNELTAAHAAQIEKFRQAMLDSFLVKQAEPETCNCGAQISAEESAALNGRCDNCACEESLNKE